jgi:hypothetical protein
MATQYSGGYAAWDRPSRHQDWALLILSIWLFISPWVLSFGHAAGAANGSSVVASRAAWDAWILGVILFLVSLSAVGRMAARQEWLALVLGIWIFIAPWVLGFVGLGSAAWDHWIVGVLVFLTALWNISAPRTDVAGSTTTPPLGPPGGPLA